MQQPSGCWPSRKGNGLRTGELVALTGYSRPVVLRNLSALTARGLVRRVGHSARDPQAYWTAELM